MKEQSRPEHEPSHEELPEDINNIVTNPTVKIQEVVEKFWEASAPTLNREEVFVANFESDGYIDSYYPPLNTKIIETVLPLIAAAEKKSETKSTHSIIDGQEIWSKLGEEFNNHENASSLVENYCIYDFIVRRALKTMLAIRPEDHFAVLDVGGGPTLYQHFPLVPVARSINHAEYLEVNRTAVEDWKKGHGHDWTSYIEYNQSCLATFFQNETELIPEVKQRLDRLSECTAEQFADEVRNTITDITPVDVFAKDLQTPQNDYDVINVGKWGSVDILSSHFCIESATAEPEEWKKGIKNICSTVKPGGFLLMTAIRNAESYDVNGKSLPAVPVDGKTIDEQLELNGLRVLEEAELINTGQKPQVGYDGMIFILAQKI